MSTSQNGYKANDPSLIATYTIVRDVKISLRKGDVSVVLLDFARWYDANIEPLTKSDTGGYNPRNIAGSTTLSNHASGTAEDLRWNKHPQGKHGTFTADQKSKINAKLKTYDGVIRWGENYSGTIDGMHFEINKPASAVAVVANRIRGGSAQKPPITAPTAVKEDGKLGPKTIALWQKIMKAKVDGVMTPTFTRTVQARLQATVDHRLLVDGVGLAQNGHQYKTVGALQRYLGSPVDLVMSTPVSTVVKALQRKLNTGKF